MGRLIHVTELLRSLVCVCVCVCGGGGGVQANHLRPTICVVIALSYILKACKCYSKFTQTIVEFTKTKN